MRSGWRVWVAVGMTLVTLLQLAALIRGAIIAPSGDAALTFTMTSWFLLVLVLVTAAMWVWAIREARDDRWRAEHQPGMPRSEVGPEQSGPNRALSGQDEPPTRW